MSDGEREGTNGSVALPRPVFIIMDEFASVGTINEFPKTLANVRRYNIKVSIIFQDTPQIQNCYPDEAQSILSNCATWLVLGVNDTDTARLLCDRIGDTTGESASYAIQKNKVMTIDPFDQRISKSETKEPLLRIGDLFTLAEVIILRSKMNVYLADPYVYLYHYLSEYVDRDDMHEHASTFDPHWAYRTMSLKRTFMLSDPNRDIPAAETGGKSDTRRRSNFIEEDDNDGNVFTSRSRRPKQDKKNDQKSEKRRPRKWETKAEEKPNCSEMEPDKDVLIVPWGTEE